MGDAAPEGRPSRTHSTRHRAGGGGVPGSRSPQSHWEPRPCLHGAPMSTPRTGRRKRLWCFVTAASAWSLQGGPGPVARPLLGRGPRPSVPRSLSVRGSPRVCSKWGGLFPRQLLWVGLGCRLRGPRRGQAGGSCAWEAGTSLKGSGRSSAGWAQGQALLREGTLG